VKKIALLREYIFHVKNIHILYRKASGTVLGLARTGLIFTGIQEGAQPGGGG